MKMNRFMFLLPSLALLASCKDDADNPSKNEENELITTVHLHLTGPSGMTMATWKDLTPNDAAGRTIDTLFLQDSTLYTGKLELKDETKSPAEDIAEEVKKEGVDHLVVYKQDPLVSPAWFAIARTDKDANNRELGLTFTLQTNALTGATGIRVLLKHQPGVKDGSEAPGDADVDVVIPVKIRK